MADLPRGLLDAINTAFKFSDYAIDMTDVGTENNIFVRTIQRVRLDLEETQRLLRLISVKTALESHPQKLVWIQNAVHSTNCSLNDIGLFVQRARSGENRDDRISFSHRVRSALKDHGKLEHRRTELTACHQTLIIILNMLHSMESIASLNTEISSTLATPPPTYENALQDVDFKSPYTRRKRRTKMVEIGTTDTNWKSDQREQLDNDNGQAAIHTPLQQPPRPESSTSVKTAATTNSRATSSTHCPIDTWDNFEVHRGEEQPPNALSETQKPGYQQSLAVTAEFPPSSPPITTIPFPGTLCREYELDDHQSPLTTPIHQDNVTTSRGEITSPSELALEVASLQIYELPGDSTFVPQDHKYSMYQLPSELEGSVPVENPSMRRHTSPANPNPTSDLMRRPIKYRAYSKPDVPQLWSQMEKMGTYPLSAAQANASHLPDELASRDTSVTIDVYRSFESRFQPVPRSTKEGNLLPRAASSSNPSSVFQVSEDASKDGSIRDRHDVQVSLHPVSLQPGYQSSHTVASQSRKRRAKIEAALRMPGEDC